MTHTRRRVLAAVFALSAGGCTDATTAPADAPPAARAATYYVSPTGDDANDGRSRATAFRTITRAGTVAQGGDIVEIADGAYGNTRIVRSGRPDAYVVYRAATRWGARVTGTGPLNAIDIDADYVELDGLEVTNPVGHCINGERHHHLRIRNNHAFGCGHSGITVGFSDFYLIEGNVTHGNARRGWYSGISVYEAADIGDASPGFHIVIRNNVSYDNITDPAFGPHTDGNGIIVDDWNWTQNPGSPYPYTGLVENNLCYGNGGAGIKAAWSDNVTFRNNTVYDNNRDPNDPGTYRGGLYNQDSRNNVWVNNVSWADPTVNPNNSALMDRGPATGRSTVANRWVNNVLWAGPSRSGVDIGDGSAPLLAGNLDRTRPLFVATSRLGTADFRLAAGSPGLDMGTAAFGLHATDLAGGLRVRGAAVDAGAYER